MEERLCHKIVSVTVICFTSSGRNAFLRGLYGHHFLADCLAVACASFLMGRQLSCLLKLPELVLMRSYAMPTKTGCMEHLG